MNEIPRPCVAWPQNEAHPPSTLDAIHAAARVAEVPYEIVVADDASSDATAEVARTHGATVVGSDGPSVTFRE